jgi:hypothetical protein
MTDPLLCPDHKPVIANARHLVRYSTHLDDHDADNAARERARQCPQCHALNDGSQP